MQLDGLVNKLDKSALNLERGRYDENIFELEFNLWGLVHLLAQKSPKELKESFKFTKQTVDAIKSASISSIGSLANPNLLSFTLVCTDVQVKKAIDSLNVDNHQFVYLSKSVAYDEFSYAYWQILNRLSIKNVDYASVVFGVSPMIAKEVKQLTDIKLRLLAAQFPPVFKLRFCQNLILERLNNPEIKTISYFKSIQLALKT